MVRDEDVSLCSLAPNAAAGEGQLLVRAREIQRQSIAVWGQRKVTTIIGRHPRFAEALERAARLALADAATLITGETGTGKELFARALYLLSPRRGRQFVCVNCAQYQDSQLIASELFGHKRGSFTGAVADHHGVFESAEGGVVFLDEVAELSVSAQSMLLRALSESEIVPVGDTKARPVNVRVIAATSRDLNAMVRAGSFRSDLYFRLRILQLDIPPVRDRDRDWELIAVDHLRRLSALSSLQKTFSTESLASLSTHTWPGNVREIKSVVDTAFYLTDSNVINPASFAQEMESASRSAELLRIPLRSTSQSDAWEQMMSGETFWLAVHQPFLRRELSRAEARDVIERGLTRTRGSYKRLLPLFGMAADEYLKFMDFLRHQKLKPEFTG